MSDLLQECPADLKQALEAAPAAEAAWRDLTSISRRDFVAWINEAKQPQTRARRIVRCIENLMVGKRRPCCFAVVPMDLYKVLGADAAAKAQWSRLTADEKRDFSDWVESSVDKTMRKARVEKARELLASGRHFPE